MSGVAWRGLGISTFQVPTLLERRTDADKTAAETPNPKSAQWGYTAQGKIWFNTRTMQPMRPHFLLAAPAALFLPSLSASADITYNDFSSTAGLQLNGAAAQVGNALRLVPSVLNSGGSAFTPSQVPLGGLNSFSTYFQFRITDPQGIVDEDGSGADGLVFVVQTQNNNVGGAGGGIGYAGITPSVGIEFDTYNNG